MKPYFFISGVTFSYKDEIKCKTKITRINTDIIIIDDKNLSKRLNIRILNGLDAVFYMFRKANV